MKSKKKNLVVVKDRAGNEFVCDLGSLRDPKGMSDHDLQNCFEDAREALKTDFSVVSVKEKP